MTLWPTVVLYATIREICANKLLVDRSIDASLGQKQAPLALKHLFSHFLNKCTQWLLVKDHKSTFPDTKVRVAKLTIMCTKLNEVCSMYQVSQLLLWRLKTIVGIQQIKCVREQCTYKQWQDHTWWACWSEYYCSETLTFVLCSVYGTRDYVFLFI